MAGVYINGEKCVWIEEARHGSLRQWLEHKRSIDRAAHNTRPQNEVAEVSKIVAAWFRAGWR
jgi:hypothetical protein